MSLEEMQGLVDFDPQLKELLSDLMKICPAFIGYYNDDAGKHKQKLFDHLLIAVFETYFAFAIDGNDPGYIAERLLNFGSDLIWEYIRAASPQLNVKSIKTLQNVDIVFVLQTWETYISAIREEISKKGMSASDEVKAMLRPRLFHWYMKRHATYSVWGSSYVEEGNPILQKFEDAMRCPIFDETKAVAQGILEAMEQYEELGDDASTKKAFEDLLSRIDKDSAYTKAYKEPDTWHLGAKERLQYLIECAVKSPKKTVLISTEVCLWEKLDKSFVNSIVAAECDVDTGKKYAGRQEDHIKAGTLYTMREFNSINKKILIYVTCSDHVTLGYGNSYQQRVYQACRQLTNTSVYEAAGLVPKGSTETEEKRLRFFFINAEGPFGDLSGKKEEEGRRQQSNFYFAARLALPPGYYIEPIRSGVQALAHAISPGMLKHHAICLMTLLGYDNFCAFLRIHCNLELPPEKDLEMELEKIRKDFKSFNKQQQRLKRKEILQILMTPEEQRSIDDWSVLDDSVMTYGSYGTTRYAKTTQAFTEATLVVDFLDESSTNDEFSAAAKEVHSILCKDVTGVQWQGVKKRQLYLFLLAAGYSEGIIGKLRTADADIHFGSSNRSINQSTNVDPDIDELITYTE